MDHLALGWGPRAVAGVAAVSALSLFGALANYSDTRLAASQYRDPYHVLPRVEAFASALHDVPPGAPLGYFSDVSLSGAAGSAAFFATQYAVAPHLLVEPGPRARAEWWIGSFSRPVDFAAEGAARGLIFVRDVGGGMALYRGSYRIPVQSTEAR